MKKALALIFLSAGCLFASSESQAQTFRYANDALRFSRYYPGGTARMVGLGGAQIALGGDLSSAYSNPAGLGFYNRSEASITPSFTNSVNDAFYFAPGAEASSSSLYDYKSRFGIGHLGVAFNRSKKTDDRSGWLGGTFALTYQRTNTFHDRFSYEGSNPNNSFVEIFDLGTVRPLSELENPFGLTLAAYNAFLIDIFSDEDENGNTVYFYDTYQPAPDQDYPIFQKESVRTQGSQGQLNIAYGGNIGDKIYVGGGLGLTTLEYRLNTRYQEVVSDQLYVDFPGEADTYPNNRFVMESERLTTGGGVNATLGIIARPIPAISLGLSYQTPTLYELTEEEEYDITTYFLDSSSPERGNALTSFEYRLKTPGRLSGGVAAFAEKWGFISADIEYVNYGNARLTDDFGDLSVDNSAIREDLQSSINYRLGGELRYDVLRLRAGYAHQANPYANSINVDGSSNLYSVGAGLRFKQYYIDVALNQQRNNGSYNPYTLATETPRVDVENKVTSAFLTMGLTF